jgi:putative ABC transport system permease protein
LAAYEASRAQPLMRWGALVYLYRRRLRVHAVQELLAGVGVAVGVALVFATIVASASMAGSADEVVHAVVGPASLQLHSRSPEGFSEGLLARVERLPGVRQAGPLLELPATVAVGDGRSVTVDLAGADTSLVVLDGLAHTLPRETLSAGGIGLSRRSAEDLGISPTRVSAEGQPVTLHLRGRASPLKVSTVLGSEAFGALAQARVAVMPLEQLQRLAGLRGRVTRILVRTRPGRREAVRRELQGLADGRIDVAGATQDVALLRQALRPSDQASAFFATISGLLGLLFAFTALLLTVPERRRAIADLRLIGTKRSAILQMLAFQALLLGVVASSIGLLIGYELSLGALHSSPRYLAEAFTLGTRTVVGAKPLLIALVGGLLAACLASAAPLLDLRRGRALDAVYSDRQSSGASILSTRMRHGLTATAAILLTAASVLFATSPSQALTASVVLALSTVAITPLAFAAVLRAARGAANRFQGMTILPVALSSLRATTLRPLALAATGAVALFGSVALGGARGDLLKGIEGFARSYSADAPIWVGNPDDNQATIQLRDAGAAQRLSRLPGVAQVSAFYGGFAQMGGRRVWLIARPPGGARHVLESQLLDGSPVAAEARLARGGWIVVSRQIAQEHHVGVGGSLLVPTPAGARRMRIAATTTNLAWSPGVVFYGAGDFRRLWHTDAPTALALRPRPGVPVSQLMRSVQTALGQGSGLRITSAPARQRDIDRLTNDGLGQLGEISTLLLLGAIVAMAAALASAIWQRRTSLAGLRLAGVRPKRLRLILMTESGLMLAAGCTTGALSGVYGQVVIDGYLRHVTGFPVATLGASLRPLEVFALVIAAVLALAAIPGWLASRVSPALAFDE